MRRLVDLDRLRSRSAGRLGDSEAGAAMFLRRAQRAARAALAAGRAMVEGGGGEAGR